MSGSNDVERLARVLHAADGYGPWEGATNQSHYLLQARNAMARGVTLSAPVAPLLTPLQAAAEALGEWSFPTTPDGTLGKCRDPRYTTGARAVLAAAVGALPNAKDSVTEREDHVIIDNSWILRAVLLAALTEGGEG